MEEHEKFSGFLLGVLQNKRLAALQEINWYRIVLSAELVIPRLFLLTSVGAAYLSLPEALFGRCIQGCRGMSTKEQLLANVQKNFLAVCDPVMGICMRPSLYRLLGRHLHTGSVAEEDGSHWHLSIQASIDCLMQEFVIANRLWVRHRYAISDRVEPDRRQMQHLVAQSIRMMAALPGLCVDRYRSAILRVLLEHIVASRDEMAQEYLTFVILEAFPIGFHVETIVDLLDAISRYLLTVDIKLLVSTVIDRILVRPKDGEEEAAEEPNGHGKVFDELWEKISGLLLLRVETSQAEETILLCTPLLHYALEMRPLKPARVDAILKFIHISINQASAYVEEARISLTVRRIVDLVLELIADVKYIFDLPHLFMLLTDVEAANGASLGLSLVGKLGEIKYQTGEDAEHARLLEIATVIIREKGGGHIFKEEDNYEEMVESVKILKFLGETLFAGVLAGHLDQSMRQFANVILADGNILAASVLLPIATEVLLCSLDNIALIKETLHRWRRFAATTAPVHLISQAMVEERPEDVRTDLGYFVRDAPFKALVMTWRRLMEAGASTAAASDLVYESIVEIVTIFEEDVTDHRAQMDILLLVVEALGGVGRVIARPDMNVLLGKMHGYSKRLLRTEERTRMLFELLELSVMLGDQAERRLVGEVYASLSRLISAEISDATVLAHQVRMNRALVKYMMATEPITVGGQCEIVDRLTFLFRNLGGKCTRPFPRSNCSRPRMR